MSKQGFAVSLDHAAGFKGQVLSDDPGWNKNKGECATGVQYVFFKAGKPIGLTTLWKQGPLVKGNSIAPGTAIASFQNGVYAQDHAAVLIRETEEGLEVWDQFNHPPKPWGKRTLRFGGAKNDRSNNGDLFYVIIH
ncbi:BPSL0067 family protein [Tundrisphaera sp. TA3]|uniref:BPSL0067 family protein n=1 Tax=Tundrisphaera sp. TA3 TaxID=3435775 RepID=UPI003EBD2336